MIKYFKYFIILNIFFSCKIVFTEKIRDKIEKNGGDISKVQFYNSEKIVLKRILNSEEVKVASGELSIENGKNVEIIKINKKTPGRCNQYDKNHILVSFEYGQDRDLTFLNSDLNSDTSRYELMPDEKKVVKRNSIELSSDNKSIIPIKNVEKEIIECSVHYDKKTYIAEFSNMPCLLIKKSPFNYRKKTVSKKIGRAHV